MEGKRWAAAGAPATLLVIYETDGESDYLSVPAVLLGAPLGATLFNNLSRRYRTPARPSGLLNFDHDGLYAGMPAVGVTRLTDPPRTVARSVRLFMASC